MAASKRTTKNDPPMQVEAYLRAERQYNIDHSILRSENAVIERLLGRSDDMRSVYTELLKKLPQDHQWQYVVRRLVSTAAFWNPDAIRAAKEAANRIGEINSEIARKCRELADLFEKRSELANCHLVETPDDYHPVDWIIQGAEQAGDPYTVNLFKSWVKGPLEDACAQFDLKYWPTPADIFRAIAEQQHAVDPIHLDQGFRAALVSRKRSVLDFVRALLTNIAGMEGTSGFDLPAAFRLSNQSLADVANVVLDLSENQAMDADKIKMALSRIR